MIIETKLTLPQPKSRTLLRAGLIDLIKNNLDKKLILICAGAGYGKTTLLAQLIKGARLPCVFYDLEKSDSDLMEFYSYLIQSIKQIDPSLVKYPEELLKQGAEAGKKIELLFGTLINELYNKRKEELFIILDNYHNIADDSVIHQALDFFIDHLPDNIRAIISTRSVPPLPAMARWRAKQDLFEITRDDLAFTSDETSSLVKDVYKTALSEEDVRQITAHTEGWITGIRLVLQSAGKDKTTVRESLQKQLEANRPLFEYFANEIFSGESQVMQDFLAKCSILDVMTPAACDAILNINSSERTLKSLEKRHLFITLAGPQEYKYHPLFREFLHGCLKDDKIALHRKAAEHYAKQGNTEQAIDHYLEAACFMEAGNAIIRIADKLEDQAQFGRLDNWVKQLPVETYNRQPKLQLVRGALLRERGILQEAEQAFIMAGKLFKQRRFFYNQAVALMKQGEVLWMQDHPEAALIIYRKSLSLDKAGRNQCGKRLPDTIKWDLYGLVGLAYMATGETQKAKTYFIKAKRIGEATKNDASLFFSEANLALLLMEQGEVRQAFNLYQKCIGRSGLGYSLNVGFVFASAAQSAVILGETGWAEKWLQYCWDLYRPYPDVWVKIMLNWRFGLLYLQQEKWDKALMQLEQALRDAVTLNWTKSIWKILREMARVYRCRGEFAKARDFLERAQQTGGKENVWHDSAFLSEKGLTDIALNRQDEAKHAVETSLGLARKYKTHPRIIFADILAAAFYFNQGQAKKAANYLLKTIRLAREKGYDGILIREFRCSPNLAWLAQKYKLEPAYLGRILLECKKYGTEMKESSFAKPISSGKASTFVAATADKTAEKPSLTVQLLGGFELDDLEIAGKIQLRRKTTKAILAFFLLHPNKGFSWEEIVAWAWPDSAAAAAHKMFKRAVWEIHSCSPTLKAYLLYKDQHYILQAGPQLRIDAEVFLDIFVKAAAAEDDAMKTDLWEQAVSLYQGPLMPGVYYDWVDELRNLFEGKYSAALGALAQLYFDQKEYERSIALCQKSLVIDELDEDTHRRLIANYTRLGKKSQALKQYNKLVKILKKNFGAKPSSETSSLIETTC